jgi:hypothetical protein
MGFASHRSRPEIEATSEAVRLGALLRLDQARAQLACGTLAGGQLLVAIRAGAKAGGEACAAAWSLLRDAEAAGAIGWVVAREARSLLRMEEGGI